MLRSVLKLLRVPLAETNCYNAAKSCLSVAPNIPIKHLHTTSKLQKLDNKKNMMSSVVKPDEGTEGETLIDIDTIVKKGNMFPDQDTPNRLFNGVPYKEIPIINIKTTLNNTIFSVTDCKGVLKMLRSCGAEGFKNARKGTNIAAQATAISICSKALDEGFKMARVRVRGIGPGRMAAIKGIQMAGINIVSITDNTRVTYNPQRARKARRL